MEENLEDCIWGKSDWDAYTKELVGAIRINEADLLGRINVVKENVGRRIREAVEQHHPRLVEQASAVQNLDRVQATINREMSHLYKKCKELGEKFQSAYEKICHTTSRLEQLYALRQILASADRCKQLIGKLGNTTELVKRSEIICELEAVTTEIPFLKDLNNMREMVLVLIPKLTAEARKSTTSHLRSSLESLSAPLVSSCARALNNLSSYESEISRLLEENVKSLDNQLLQLNSSTIMVTKFLPQIANQIQTLDISVLQMSLEQYSLLSMRITTEFCEKLAKVISRRISENASYATRFVQILSKVISIYPANAVQPLDQSLRPLRRAILSHSLSRMFKAVDNAFGENDLTNLSVEKIDSAIKEELEGVEWDAQLSREMEVNVAKVLQLVAQKIEQHLVLDSPTLQMSERLSTAQVQNYALVSVAHILSLSWPEHNEPLIRISQQIREALMDVARSSVFTILLSMHYEKLGDPSPYYIATHGLSLYSVQSSLMPVVPRFVDAFKLSPEQLVQSESLPFWFVVQLLISMSEGTLLSPHISANWSLEEYLKWCLDHSAADHKQGDKTIEQDEEWESKTVIMEIDGIMDVNTARQALNRNDSAIRRCNMENPILQISNSLFTAEWNSIIGTDMIFKLEEKQLRFVECSDVRLKAEKALVIDNDDK
ncbi:hypothetical protein LOAG_08360 [Loa loa]|uniref:Transcription factor TFIIIC triple barrel domain-containing protein n=1 Tax=Loa loa TaxID=7209 RepID=A0A1S0TTY9_LOALO|nr:hypothetical protein LOAG_08360 [Loa loa]EFO20132.1 hypothetical protein LOAG_08360 [Loa loa]